MERREDHVRSGGLRPRKPKLWYFDYLQFLAYDGPVQRRRRTENSSPDEAAVVSKMYFVYFNILYLKRIVMAVLIIIVVNIRLKFMRRHLSTVYLVISLLSNTSLYTCESFSLNIAV